MSWLSFFLEISKIGVRGFVISIVPIVFFRFICSYCSMVLLALVLLPSCKANKLLKHLCIEEIFLPSEHWNMYCSVYSKALNCDYFDNIAPSELDLFVESSFVYSQAIPRGKYFVTEVTWNTYSFQMIGLNVSSYVCRAVLLATHFAN